MKFSNEQVELIRSCKSAEELVEKAAAAGTSISLEQAGKIMESNEFEELGEDSLDVVSGGCGTTYEETCYLCGTRYDYRLPAHLVAEAGWNGSSTLCPVCDNCLSNERVLD